MRFHPIHVAVTVDSATDPAWQLIERIRRGGFRGQLSVIGSLPGSTAKRLEELETAPDLAFLGGSLSELERRLQILSAGATTVVITTGLPPEARERLAPFSAGLRLLGPSSEGAGELSSLFNATPFDGLTRPGAAGLVSVGPGSLGLLQHPTLVEGQYGRIVSLGEGWYTPLSEVLRDWQSDPSLGVMGVVLDPTRPVGELLAPLREAASHKPLVILFSGDGATALAQHTGAAVAETPQEFHELIRALNVFNVWDGERLALLGSDEPSLQLARRLLESEGLQVGPLSSETVQLLYRLGALERINPVLLPPSSSPHDESRAAELILSDEAVDAVVVVASHRAGPDLAELATLLSALSTGSAKPLGVLVSGQPDSRDLLSYEDPAALARNLRKLSEQGRRRFRGGAPRTGPPPQSPSDFDLQAFGIMPEPRYHQTGPTLETWRDAHWGPLVRLVSHGATAILPSHHAEALEWLEASGLEDPQPVASLLLQLRDCYDACPELSRVELEATSEPGVVADRGLRVEFSS